MNWSTNFRGFLLKVEMAPSCLKHKVCFICVHIEANALYCLLQTMQQGFGLGMWIAINTRTCVVCIYQSETNILWTFFFIKFKFCYHHHHVIPPAWISLTLHCLWQVFRATSVILTELLYVCSSWSSSSCSAICGGP